MDQHKKPAWQRSLISMSAVVIVALVFGMLYWMRALFIPLTMAVFLSYVLSPLVNWVQRKGLARTPTVLLVVGFTLLLFGGTLFTVGRQLDSLSETLADNKERIKQKIVALQSSVVGNSDSRRGQLIKEIEEILFPPSKDPAPLVLKQSKTPWLTHIQSLLEPVGEVLAMSTFAFILVVFILLSKEDIQDRILRVLGDGQLSSATRATGDANRRVSRYLLAQLVLNIIFGLIIALSLYAIGLQYALLWAFIAAFLRYIPYLGTWLGVILPVTFSIAVSDGWWQPLGVFGIYIGLELICNNFVEPRLYGTSMGLSEVALLIAAAFWSFLWGPIGLILSGPITTCLLMLGKYNPTYRFLQILLGTDPPLTPGLALFQRLLASNPDDALRVVETASSPDKPIAVFDTAVIPALSLLKQAMAEDDYDETDEKRILAVTTEVVEDLTVRIRAPIITGGTDKESPMRLLACVAGDPLDKLCTESFTATLPKEHWEVGFAESGAFISELIDRVTEFDPKVVVVGCVGPLGANQIRYACKRIRGKFPNLYILVAWWGEAKTGELVDGFIASGASAVETSFPAAKDLLASWRPVFLVETTATTKSINDAKADSTVVGAKI